MTERENLIEQAAKYAECRISRNGEMMEMTEDEMAYIWQSAMSSGRARVILVKYAAFISALEASGVRLVPVEATWEMIQMAEMLDTIDELTTDEYRRAYSVMVAFSPYAPKGTPKVKCLPCGGIGEVYSEEIGTGIQCSYCLGEGARND